MTDNIIESFEKIKKCRFGARFYKADLHFHTPASEDARGSNKYNFNPYQKTEKKGAPQKIDKDKLLNDARCIAQKIVERFVEEKLSIVAVTDHNSIGTLWFDDENDSGIMDLKAPTWYEIIDDEAQKINAEAKRQVLQILPGVEISNNGMHLLAIFPQQSPRRAAHFIICDLLYEIGFKIEEWGNNPETGKESVFRSIEIVRKKGGIAIPAHIDADDQAMLKLFPLTGDSMEEILKSNELAALEIVKPEKFRKIDAKLKMPVKQWLEKLRDDTGAGSIAFLQGSDAHDLPNIGKRFTYLKMTEPSFNGLADAFKIPSSRARISDEHKQLENGRFIYGIEIENKYFGKQFIRFNRQLNFVCGKKESGKTYLYNLMQYAFNSESKIEDGSIKIFMESVKDKKSEYYVFVKNQKENKSEVYLIDPEKKNAKKIEETERKKYPQPKFFEREIIKEIIENQIKLQEFLVKHFGEPNKENTVKFNKIFESYGFLENTPSQILKLTCNNNKYELEFNVNGPFNYLQPKLAGFETLNNSAKYCAIIMILVIAEQFGPVTIDAPEEFIDNSDAGNYLAPVIRKYKDFQQINIFSSNPVFSIDADPENFVFINSSSKKKIEIISGFSIDDINNKKLLLELFEGSAKSFNRRKERYGF